MSNVLYDEPGPRARRLSLIGTVIASLVILGLLAIAVLRLADRGQFEWELWAPLLDPGNENFALVWELLAKGLQATLVAAALAIILSLVVGTAVGTARLMLGRWQRLPLVGLIELFRGLPVIVTIYFVYIVVRAYDLPVSVLPGEDGLWFLVIGLTLYNSVIIAEILRAGVLALPSGQREAALAVGMTNWQAMATVQLPQAFRTMLPALISQLVVVLKDTSLIAILGLYTDLLRQGNLISLNLDNPIQMLFVVGLIFIVINYGLSRLAVWIERRASRAGRPTAAGEADDVVAVGA